MSYELYLRLGTAVLAGLLVGFEREVRGHPAGMRTHTLVAVGAALFTLAGAHGFPEVARSENVDPARLAAQVASGIGFIGAGAIIRDGAGVRGITTAATLWLSGALGVAAGAGMYVEVATGTTFVLLVLTGLRLFKPALHRIGGSSVLLHVEYERGHGTLGPLLRGIDDLGGKVQQLTIDDAEDDDSLSGGGGAGLRRVSVRVSTREEHAVRDLVQTIQGRPEVRTLHLDGRSE